MEQKNEKYFSVGQAAKELETTSETLRHYDRIGLVKPGKKDEWTGYRYYTEHDLVRLKTVRALQQMGLPLREIKHALEYQDLQKLVDFLAEAERKADEKIAMLLKSKEKIRLARADYEKKLYGRQPADGAFIRELPPRVIMLSDTLETPELDNLWNYWRHFYDRLEPGQREEFEFEDQAGIYSEEGLSRLFAICTRHGHVEGLRHLPGGKYLCANCGRRTGKPH